MTNKIFQTAERILPADLRQPDRKYVSLLSIYININIYNLIKSVTQLYLKTRIYFLDKKCNNIGKVRNYYTKLILFKCE